MKRSSTSEKVLIKEIAQAAHKAKTALKSLSIGALIKLIRTQLGMSQRILAKRANVPQSTVSRIEQGQRDANLSSLNKILDALACDLIIIPLLREPIDVLRLKQAKKIAKKHIHYLKGTMSLEKQHPDDHFMDMLLKEEEDQLLDSNTKLWEE